MLEMKKFNDKIEIYEKFYVLLNTLYVLLSDSKYIFKKDNSVALHIAYVLSALNVIKIAVLFFNWRCCRKMLLINNWNETTKKSHQTVIIDIRNGSLFTQFVVFIRRPECFFGAVRVTLYSEIAICFVTFRLSSHFLYFVDHYFCQKFVICRVLHNKWPVSVLISISVRT